MATRKRNEWLEAEDSDSDVNYASEEESKGRTVTGRAPKRRKTDDDSEAEQFLDIKPQAGLNLKDDDDDDNDDYDDGRGDLQSDDDLSRLLALKRALPDSRFNVAAFEDDEDDETNESAAPRLKLPTLSKSSAEKAEKAARKTGVLYLSRIPPFMKPSTLRSLLAPYGALNRIFLTPETAAAHSSRVRAGGNKKKSYTDGWVEFVNKRDAKNCAALLNGRNIGGKGWYRDDVWVLKYLKGFKWKDLTEQIGNETAERASRVRAEVARSTKEQKMFVEGVERGKMLQTMESRKIGRMKDLDDGDDGVRLDDMQVNGGLEERPIKPARTRKSQFRQNEVQEKVAKRKVIEQPAEVKRVLSKIF